MKTKDQLVSIGLTEMKADEVMMLESPGREWHTPERGDGPRGRYIMGADR